MNEIAKYNKSIVNILKKISFDEVYFLEPAFSW